MDFQERPMVARLKKCAKAGCSETIAEKYTFCYNHYVPGGRTAPVKSQNDPVLELLEHILEEIRLLRYNQEKIGRLSPVLEDEVYEPQSDSTE